jgi:hypothetical protein
MKHIKKFESFQLNEDAHWLLLGAGGISLIIFLKKLFKDRKERKFFQKLDNMTTQEVGEYKKQIHKNLESVNFRILNRYIDEFLQKDGDIKFSENYLYYFFDLNDLRIRIDKRNKTIQWNRIDFKRLSLKHIIGDKDKFIDPIPVSEEEIQNLIDSVKEKIIEENE